MTDSRFPIIRNLARLLRANASRGKGAPLLCPDIFAPESPVGLAVRGLAGAIAKTSQAVAAIGR